MVGRDPEDWSMMEPLFRDTAVEKGYFYAGKFIKESRGIKL